MKRLLVSILVLASLGSLPASAQTSDDPAALKLAEPDFTLITLPTSLRLPKFGSAFRVTHRFTRPLSCDGCTTNLLEDFFGLDSGAVIGLELRVGIVPNGQIGIHRTGSKTIEFFGQYAVLRQSAHGLDVSGLVTVEGTNNFRDSYSPAVGAIVGRTVGDVAAFYVEPIWVNNTNALPKQLVNDNNTFIVGVGARVRVLPTVYLVGEAAPRTGYKPGVTHGSFGIEKRAGGHVFQLNFSNGFGTTMAQIARGGPAEKDWYLGFNISRKFF